MNIWVRNLTTDYDKKLLLPMDIEELEHEFGASSYGKEKYNAEELYWIGYIYRYWCYTRELTSKQLYKIIKPKESIVLPLIFEYKLADDKNDHISKTISFDVRTSLYNEPTNFKVAIKANKAEQLEEKVSHARKQITGKYKAVVIDK